MGIRTTRETLYLKYEFDNTEKLAMASTLASNHNRLQDVKVEEQQFKAQMADRKATIEGSIQSLSRSIYTGWEMRNIPCLVRWDSPNINEVEYVREDTGEVVKTRAMDSMERQQELEFRPIEEAPDTENSVINIESFFGEGSIDARTAPDPDAVFSNPDPSANLEAVKEENDEAWHSSTPSGFDPTAKRGRGRPKKVDADNSEVDF